MTHRSMASAPPPDRSLTQRLDALERANEIRSARALLKRDLKAGRVSVVTLLQNPPSCIDTMKVYDLLMAVPKVGRVKASKVLTQCRVAPSKTVGRITIRQRRELAGLLRCGVTEFERAMYRQQLGRPDRQRVAA